MLFSAPLQRHLYPFIALEWLVGFFGSGIEIACNTLILELWQRDANPIMQGLFLSYAVAQTLSPILLEPFLSVPAVTVNNTMTGEMERESRILIPFAITSVILWCCGLVVILIQLKYPYSAPEADESPVTGEETVQNKVLHDSETDATKSRHKKSKVYEIMIISLACMFLFFYNYVQCSSLTYISIFAASTDLHLSKSTATFMASVLGGAYATGRAISVLVATKVKVDHMLYAHLAIVLMGNGLLSAFANTSELMIWISVVLMGAGFSSIFPGFLSFVQQRIHVSNQICGVITCFSAASAICGAFVLGNVIESHPMIFAYLNIAGVIATAIVLLAFHMVDFFAGHGRN